MPALVVAAITPAGTAPAAEERIDPASIGIVTADDEIGRRVRSLDAERWRQARNGDTRGQEAMGGSDVFVRPPIQVDQQWDEIGTRPYRDPR